MDFTFKLFEPHKAQSLKADEPLVEIRPNGRIVFNKMATELLSCNDYCMLGYDSENNALGLLPINERTVNSFPIRYASKGAYIGAKKFFKHFGILPGQLIENSPFYAGEFIGIKL